MRWGDDPKASAFIVLLFVLAAAIACGRLVYLAVESIFGS